MASVEADDPLRGRRETRLRARVIGDHHGLIGRGLRESDGWRVEQRTGDQRQQADPSSNEADRHRGPPRVVVLPRARRIRAVCPLRRRRTARCDRRAFWLGGPDFVWEKPPYSCGTAPALHRTFPDSSHVFGCPASIGRRLHYAGVRIVSLLPSATEIVCFLGLKINSWASQPTLTIRSRWSSASPS